MFDYSDTGESQSAWDACSTAIDNYQDSANFFSSNVSDFVDGGSTSFGDVVQSGIDAAAARDVADMTCDSGSFGSGGSDPGE